jgi:hypothetical protein
MLRKDPRAAMEQGGWLDIRSVIGYSYDLPEHRRRLVAEVDEAARHGGAPGKKRPQPRCAGAVRVLKSAGGPR